jgi:hypothetical protein
MLADQDAEARAGGPPRLLGELQQLAVEAEGVVAGDDALLLVTQDLGEVDAAERDEGRGRVVGGRLNSSS